MRELIQQIIDNPLPSLAIIGNLIIIESLLSVDNAAVLATIVMDLEPKSRKRALRYGILGAYVFRGTAMVFASFIIRIWWLKPGAGSTSYTLSMTGGKGDRPNQKKTSSWIRAGIGFTAQRWVLWALFGRQ